MTQKYYRLRMQALKWYLFALDENYRYMADEHHHGPYKQFKDATAKAEELRAEGILDLDRQDNVPRGSALG